MTIFECSQKWSSYTGLTVSTRQNDLRNLQQKILSEVYKNTEIEPNSTLLTDKEFTRTANSTNKARPTTEHVGFGKEANKHLKKGPPSA